MIKKDVFGECSDCGFKAKSAIEFSDHVHAVGNVKPCKTPVEWEPTKDWQENRRREEEAGT